MTPNQACACKHSLGAWHALLAHEAPYTKDVKTTLTLTLRQLNGGIHQVLASDGEHVGNLKRIGGTWKFKAIGYESNGEVVPGGGPFTESHNVTFVTLDLDLITTTLRKS